MNSKIFIFLYIILFTSSCVSYHESNLALNQTLNRNDYANAQKIIEKNKFLKKDRNEMLKLLEQGRIAFLNRNFSMSNQYLNQADNLIEDFKRNVGSEALALVTNDEMRPFRIEEFESILVNYYKGLNYIALGQNDEAIVEVRKLNIKLNAMKDKKIAKKYAADAFAMNLQGMLYEATGDLNNAFIAYRNALEVYLDHDGSYYGVTTPKQLEQDVLRTANRLGFKDEKLFFERKIGTELQRNYKGKGKPDAYGIIFIEDGLGPIKVDNYITFFGHRRNGVVTYYNNDIGLDFIVPFSNDDINNFEAIRVAFPKYVKRGSRYENIQVTNSNTKQTYTAALAQNISVLAIQNLNERMHREIGKAVIRLALKKLSEQALAQENEGAGAALSLVNFITEKADTRNWQSLPDKVYYVKVPLKKGQNKYEINLSGGGFSKNHTVEFNVTEQTAPIQFSWITETVQKRNIYGL